MKFIEMCVFYGYDLEKRKATCRKGHKASLKCHSAREDCPGYVSTGDCIDGLGRHWEAQDE